MSFGREKYEQGKIKKEENGKEKGINYERKNLS
jgi:hypothetical protein